MKNCTYTLYFGDQVKEYTWEQLVKEIINHPAALNISDIADVVFSKGDPLKTVVTKLRADKKHYVALINETPKLSTDPVYKDDKTKSMQEFIDDSSLFVFRGKYTPVQPLNRADFIKSYIASEVKKGSKEEDAAAKANLLLNNWDRICKDSLAIHSIINGFNWFDYPTRTKFQLYILEHYPDLVPLAGTIFALIYEGSNSMMAIMYGRNKQLGKAHIITGLNLIGHIDMYDMDIVAHYDNIVVDSSGHLHIYDYVVTTEEYEDWDSNKKDKYKYKMALKKLILALNGYDISNCSLHLVPIKLSYNEDMSKISELAISAANPKNLDYFQNKYVFEGYDSVARYFVKSKSSLETALSDLDLDVILKNIDFFLPKTGVTAKITLLTAEKWILENYSMTMYGKILKSDKEGFSYKVYLNDDYKDPVYIKESTTPTRNKELLEVVTLNLEKLHSSMSNMLSTLRDKLKTFYNTGNRAVLDGDFLGSALPFIVKSIAPYLKTLPKIGNSTKDTYEWDLVNNPILDAAGILAFRNQLGLLNFIVLSDLNLKEVVSEYGQDTIVGLYVPNNLSGELIRFKNNYANILAIRTMLILNEALPKMALAGDILGEIKILSVNSSGELESYSILDLSTKIIPKMVSIILEHNRDFTFTNNFKAYKKFTDPLLLLLFLYKNIKGNLSIGEQSSLDSVGFEIFQNETSKDVIRKLLISLIGKLENLITNDGRSPEMLDPKYIFSEANSKLDSITKAYCSLYIQALKALAYYSNYTVQNEKVLGWVDKYSFKTNRHPNATFRLCSNIYARAIDEISDLTASDVYPVLNIIRDFYKDAGYTSILNDVIGNASSVYANLYAGPMILKNPYKNDSANQLKDYERKFLKRILFEMAKIKAKLHGITFDFTSASDPDLELFIEENPWYLYVPLEKASAATKRANMLSGKTSIIERVGNKFKSVKEAIKTFGSKEVISPDDVKSIYLLKLRSEFSATDGIGSEGRENVTKRMEALDNNPEGYWETNLESVFIDYVEDYNKTKILNLAFIEMKSILLSLHILKDSVNMADGIRLTLKLIHDFIKLNFFDESIMSPAGQKAAKWILPFRTLVSRAFIAGNLVSAFRDVTEGLLLNTMRTINHFHTDLTSKNVASAYAYVTTHMWQDCMSINKIDLLCKIYRLSNMDISRVSEGLKTNRGGILNIENWMYATLRKPDFLNRMVLFVARCMQDGCWDAISIKNGVLTYNPKEDKRYSVYLSNNIIHPDYKKQRDAYYNALMEYNKENGTDYTPNSETLLPVAYSNRQILEFRDLSNDIYGAYDKSMRAGYENLFIGVMCGSFTTWMNGIWANMAAHPDIYEDSHTEQVDATDEEGNLVYIDGNFNEVSEIVDALGNKSYIYTNSKEAYDGDPTLLAKKINNVPGIVLGTYYTFKHAINALKKGYDNPNSSMWELFKLEIFNDEKELENMNKILTDLLAMLLISLLFKMVITPGYLEFKKHPKEHTALEDTLAYLMYSSTSRSYDGFLGPINVFLQLGENMNPPFYSLPIKITTDLSKVIFGDKTITNMLVNDIAIAKNAQGFYKHYIANN